MSEDGRVTAIKDLIKAGKIKTVKDVQKLIKELFPEGLDAYLDKQCFGGCGYMIGFNLNRYVYTDELAANLHALEDTVAGRTGASYGFEFHPHVVTHEATEDHPEHYEVYTG
jgi:hypothetical protein